MKILIHLSCEYDRKGTTLGTTGHIPKELEQNVGEILHRARPREIPIATECSSHDGATVDKANGSAEQTRAHSLYSLLRNDHPHMHVKRVCLAPARQVVYGGVNDGYSSILAVSP